jgi:acetate kinase
MAKADGKSDGKSADAPVLTINAGSSSVKFALYTSDQPPARLDSGKIERLDPSDHTGAAQQFVNEIGRRLGADLPLRGIGHRVVHGGVKLTEHRIIDEQVLAELKDAVQLDRAHLPREIALIEALARRYPRVPQVACLDTAFFGDLPRVAQLLPIPRRFIDAGVRRLGFHGLSYTYLMEELRRVVSANIAGGRVILAHLGSGASMAAVRNGKPVDTSMALTPTAGLVMGTRPGDLDPGLVVHLMRSDRLSPDAMDELLNSRCGMAGVSDTSADMRDLMAKRGTDPRAAEAVELFCYQARKFVGAYAAAMGGLDALVFAGGIGENSPEVRGEICQGLDFFGLRIDAARNASRASQISTDDSRVSVRVIRTDEELVIARTVLQLIDAAETRRTS